VLSSVGDKKPQISLSWGVILSQSTFHLVYVIDLPVMIENFILICDVLVFSGLCSPSSLSSSTNYSRRLYSRRRRVGRSVASVCLSVCLLFVRPLTGRRLELSAPSDQSRQTYCTWQDLGMHWPWGQNVKSQLLTLGLGF